jgi:hypothetical protein
MIRHLLRHLSRSVRLLPCCAMLLVAACSGSESRTRTSVETGRAAPSAADSAAVSARTRTIALSAIAGRWNMRAVPERGDTFPTFYVLTATADTAGWSIAFPNQKPIPIRVLSVAGDSIIVEAGPYLSARRRGVQVRTHTVVRRRGEMLVGRVVAHYSAKGPDTLINLRTEGIRAR